MCSNKNNKILEECINKYKNMLEKNKLPIANKELKKIHSDIFEMIIKELKNNVLGENLKNLEERLIEEIDQRFILFKKKNIGESKKIAKSFLELQRIEIKKDLKNLKITTQLDLKERLNEIKNLYEDKDKAGPSSSEKDKLFIEWYQKIFEESNEILERYRANEVHRRNSLMNSQLLSITGELENKIKELENHKKNSEEKNE